MKRKSEPTYKYFWQKNPGGSDRLRLILSPGLNYSKLISRFFDLGHGQKVSDHSMFKMGIQFDIQHADQTEFQEEIKQYFTALGIIAETKNLKDIIDGHNAYNHDKLYESPMGGQPVKVKQRHKHMSNTQRERLRNKHDRYASGSGVHESAWDKLMTMVHEATRAVAP